MTVMMVVNIWTAKTEAEWPQSDHAEEHEQTHLYLVRDSQPSERATASAESSGGDSKKIM